MTLILLAILTLVIAIAASILYYLVFTSIAGLMTHKYAKINLLMLTVVAILAVAATAATLILTSLAIQLAPKLLGLT